MNRRLSRRSESGFTLLELLISFMVGTLVVVPAVAWIALTYRQNVEQTNRARADTLVSLARTMFGRDVASANGITLEAEDCAAPSLSTGFHVVEADPAGSDATSTGASEATPLVSLSFDDNGNSASRTVYLVEPDEGGHGTLVRHRCGATEELIDSYTLGGGLVAPSGGWASLVECSARPGYPNGDCGRVTLRLPSRGRREAVNVTLRTGPSR